MKHEWHEVTMAKVKHKWEFVGCDKTTNTSQGHPFLKKIEYCRCCGSVRITQTAQDDWGKLQKSKVSYLRQRGKQ